MSTAPPSLPAHGHHLRVAGATKRFGRTTALDHVSIDIEPGRFAVLLGPSGSGNSTLVRCLAGIERLDQGTIHHGHRLVADGRRHLPPEKRDLAMVFQDYALWPHLTALGNVEYALRRRHLPSTEARCASLDALDRVGLAHLAARYPSELSGGEQQRVGLARALVARPGMLLFDEPLSNLDADLRERLRIEISTLARDTGATCVYITHDQREAFALADLVGVLHEGHLVQVGNPEDIYARPATPFVAAFTGLAGQIEVDAMPLAPEPGRGTFRLAGATGELHGRWCGPTDQPAGRALLALRPTAVRLQADGTGTTTVAATVVDSAFRGQGYDHVLALVDGTILVGVFSEHRWERARNVQVSLEPDGCLLYPGATPTPPEATETERPSGPGAAVAPRGLAAAAPAVVRS